MLTGFEALGAASAVLQVISFSGSVIAQCYRIYDGRLTAENDLEEHASLLIDATVRVQTRCQAMTAQTEDEKKLAEIARKCQDAAEALQTEAQLVTSLCQKGKFRKAVHATFRSSKHRNNIQHLEKALNGHRVVMETQLIRKLCTSNDAIQLQQSESFKGLESDVQSLVSRIANGFTKVEDLIKTEHITTRGLIENQARIIRGDISTETHALGAKVATDKQRERLLRSLKADEMNQRYNDVMDSGDATFERVFRSYERMTRDDGDSRDEDNKDNEGSDEQSEYDRDGFSDQSGELKIDQEWSRFVSWLKSNEDSIFWIQGKPGSGKSTLMKFVINNKNTGLLLGSWCPNFMVLSHFFWRIGSPPQSSIKGLLCSLLYQALSGSPRRVDQVLDRFGGLESMDTYHDWSVRKSEVVLFSILEDEAQSWCIFIDGLDEISGKDGYDKVMGLVGKLNMHGNVKVCVSSRPEKQLVEALDRSRSSSLRLEDLTRPEMLVHVYKQLEIFRADGRISSSLVKRLANMLIARAEGVFLWVFLAIQSVVSGLRNLDDEQTLLKRLEELPKELEELYADIWARSNVNNSVYRESAGRYLRCIIRGRRSVWPHSIPARGKPFHLTRPTILEIILTERTDMREVLLSRPNEISFADLKQLCERAGQDIYTRCAGLLQPRPITSPKYHDEEMDAFKLVTWEPRFIHRTARDFLVETEAGQSILNYNHDPSRVDDVKVTENFLCLVSVMHSKFRVKFPFKHVIHSFPHWAKGETTELSFELLLSMQELFENGALVDSLPPYPQSPFIVAVAGFQYPGVEEFVIHSLQRSGSTRLATEVLYRLIPIEGIHRGVRTKFVREIMSLGADPHALCYPLVISYPRSMRPAYRKDTAFGKLLSFALLDSSLRNPEFHPHAAALLETAIAMAASCPNWNQKILVSVCYKKGWVLSTMKRMLPWSTGWPLASSSFNILFEANFQYLFQQFLASMHSFNVQVRESWLQEFSEGLKEPSVRIRCIVVNTMGSPETHRCHRVLSQQPFDEPIAELFAPGSKGYIFENEQKYITALLEDPRIAERAEFESEIERWVEEGLATYSRPESY